MNDPGERSERHDGVGIDPRMPSLGATIAGKYRLDAIIGRGGMSVVYRAMHLELDQHVAIKILSASALVMPEYVARLKREARAASRIRNEHVVRVFDIGELDGGIPYLVMEHLEGSDLSALLARKGPLSVHLAIDCILQACEALAEAHAVGIIHRDIKPANLFLTESADGSPCLKVLDFGISRSLSRPALSPLTDPGIVLGTPSYMAPEQMEGGAIDARSDIWALGAILYELLVGRPPYSGDSLPRIFMKILKGKTPRPSAKRRDLPPEIDKIIARCLALDPNDRFASVADLAWALSEIGNSRTRDSAARISRVLVRKSGESSATLPSAVVHDAPTRRERAIPFDRVAAVALAALICGSVIGIAIDMPSPPPVMSATPTSAEIVIAQPEPDPEAIAFTPIVRPLPEPEAAPAPPPPQPVFFAVDGGAPPPPPPAIAAAKAAESDEGSDPDTTD